MRAGLLRHRVTIQDFTEVPDEFGEPDKTWFDFADAYASVQPISGREFWHAQQVNAKVTHRVRMRWREGLKSTMRILHNSRTLQVEAIRDIDERRIEVDVLCSEVVP